VDHLAPLPENLEVLKRLPRSMVLGMPGEGAMSRAFFQALGSDPALAASVGVGSRVRVPLHGRRVAAWVVADDVTPDAGVHPLELTTSSGVGPPPPVIALADWAAWRWEPLRCRRAAE